MEDGLLTLSEFNKLKKTSENKKTAFNILIKCGKVDGVSVRSSLRLEEWENLFQNLIKD